MKYRTDIGYVPGIIGRVAELHALYYAENWNFSSFFEGKVAAELSQFIAGYDPDRDRIWSAVLDGPIEGSITINGSGEAKDTAHLRWFIMSDRLRGQGAGNHLMQSALDFCREAGFSRVYLWTFKGLHAARHLYEKYGFRLTEEHSGDQWGTTVTEQRFDLVFPAPRRSR